MRPSKQSPKPSTQREFLRREHASDAWRLGSVRQVFERCSNERRLGRIVWNRTRFVKAPGTNRRVARPRSGSEWRTHSAPGLRLVTDELWQRVQDRLRWLWENYTGNRGIGLLSRSATSKYPFSGMLVCAECGGRLAIITGSRKKDHPRWGCPRSYSRGTCSNSLRERNDRVEARLLEGLQEASSSPKPLNTLSPNLSANSNSAIIL